MKRLILLFVFLLLMPAFTAFALDSGDIPEKVRLVINKSDYPDASQIILDDRTEVNLEDNGDYTERAYSLTRVLTEDAKKEFFTMTFSYHSKYQKIDELSVRIFYPDGTFKEIGSDAISDSTSPELQSMNIYEPSFRQKTVTLGDVPVGATVEVLKVTQSAGLIKNGFIENYYFQSVNPVLFSCVTLKAPDSKRIFWQVSNKNISFKKTDLPGSEQHRVQYYWEAVNSPQIIPEPNMPAFQDVAMSLSITTFKDWKEASNYYYELNKDKYAANEAIKKKVKELTANLKTDDEKILAIHKFIARNIRYMGSSMDVSAFIEAHDASYTFEKGYGICRDKALLMTTMLRVAGLQCCDLLINPSSETDPKVPTVFFAHAVCMVTNAGRTIIMDPTDEMSTELGSYYAGDRYALPLIKEGHDLIMIEHFPSSRSMGKIVSASKLSPGGILEMAVSIQGTGLFDVILRQVKSYFTDELYRQYFGRLASVINPGSRVTELVYGNVDDLDGKFDIKLKLESVDYGLQANEYMLVPFPNIRLPFDPLISPVLSGVTSLKERKYDLTFFAPCSCVVEDTLEIPDGYKVKSLPDNLKIVDDNMSVDFTFTQKGNTVVFLGKYSVEKRIIPLSDYPRVKSIVSEMKKMTRKIIILEKV